MTPSQKIMAAVRELEPTLQDRDFAARVNCNRGAPSLWRNGINGMKIDTAVRIANIFNLDLNKLLLRRSSEEEQLTVNQQVAGSTPAGASKT